MNPSRVFLPFVGVIFTACCAFSQEEPVWKTSRIADRIYELTTDGGGYVVKVIASVGDDGVLIVDAGQQRTAEALKAALEQFGKGLPAVIINTHSHIEHTGGNIAFGKLPIIIGHDNLRKRLLSGSFLFDEFSQESVPGITFSDSLKIHFNGDEIRLIAFPGAHDDSDIIVWFTESKVVCVGALCNGRHFPSVDDETGDVLKYAATARRVIDALPEDVTIIPGHGEDCTLDDFRAFHDMLVKTAEIVRAGLAEGKDAEVLAAEDVLNDWGAFECSYVDKSVWIECLADGFERSDAAPDTRKKLYEPMYYAIKETGADGAIKKYYEIKASRQAEYRFEEGTLLGIAYRLYTNGKYPEAVKFFELCASEYPEGDYTALCYNYAGNAHSKMGARDIAVRSYRRALEIDPGNAYARKMLEELGAGSR